MKIDDVTFELATDRFLLHLEEARSSGALAQHLAPSEAVHTMEPFAAGIPRELKLAEWFRGRICRV